MTLKKVQVKTLKAFLSGCDIVRVVDDYYLAQLEIKIKDLGIIQDLSRDLIEENQ